MFRLKSGMRTRLCGAETPGQQEENAPTPSSSRLAPRRKYLFGRQLSFSISGDSVQLAAVSRFGLWARLLDARKTYVVSSLSTPEERLNYVTNAIGEYIRQFGGRYPALTVTVSGAETAFRTFTMPRLPKKELDSAVEYQAKRGIPFPIHDSEHAYRPTEKLTGDGRRVRISLLAATRHLIDEALKPFDRLGLEVSHIYHSQDANGQLLASLPGFSVQNRYALVNIERHSTEISFYDGCELEFFHVSNVGSSVVADGSYPTAFDHFTQSLSTVVQNSLDYYAGQFAARLPNQIFVYGDLAYTDELMELLGHQFGLSFQRFPAEDLGVVRGVDPELRNSVSVCLPAVAGASCDAELANLLPKVRRLRRKTRRMHSASVSGLATLLVFLTIGWLAGGYQVRRTEEHLVRLTERVESSRNSQAYRVYHRLSQQIADNQSYLNSIQQTPSHLGLSLKELSRLTPASVRLYSLEYNPGLPHRNLDISGVVTHRRTPPEIILAEYVEDLRTSPLYDDVIVNRHSKRWFADTFELDFRISARGVR